MMSAQEGAAHFGPLRHLRRCRGAATAAAALTARQTSLATVSLAAAALDHGAARVFRGDGKECLTQPLMKVGILGLEAVGLAVAAAQRGARHAKFDRHVENDGEVRRKIADRDPLKPFDQAQVDPAQNPPDRPT